MSSSSLFVGGLISGIDTSSLIQQLMSVERRPRDLLAARKTTITQQQSALKDFQSRLAALRDAAKAIDNRASTLDAAATSEELLSFKATSSDEGIVRATASGAASAGAYSVRVEQLARVGRELSRTFASDTSTIASSGQSLTVSFGTSSLTVNVGTNGASLRDLRDAINTSPSNGGNVRAEVVYDGTSYRLLLSGVNTGAANEIGVTTDVPGPGGLSFIDPTLEQTAQNATVKLLGLTITRATNTVSDALPGVTLTLLGTHSAVDTTDADTVTVSRDDSAVAAKLQKLVDTYNAVRDFVSGQVTPDPTTKKTGVLGNDSTLRDVERRLQSAVSKEFQFSGNALNGLSGIGLSFDSKGKLKLDSAKLTAALDANPQSVRQLLAGNGTTDGLATGVARVLDDVLQSSTGVLATRDAGLTTRIKDIDTQLARLDRTLSEKETSLRLRFSALETTLAQLQNSSGFLSRI